MDLVLNLRSSEIDGAIYERNREGLIEIKKISRSPRLVLPQTALYSLWRKMENDARILINELGGSASKSVAVFSPPWYFSEIRRVFIEKTEPMLLTMPFIDETLAKETEKFKKSAFENFHLNPEEAAILGAQIINAKLNGYPVADPMKNIVGKKIKTFELTLYLSAVFGDIERTVKNILSERARNNLLIQTSAFMFYNLLSRSSKRDIIVLNIDAETTELTAIKEGELIDSVSFGSGINFAARRLGEYLNLNPNEAASMLENYIENKLEAEASKTVKDLFSRFLDEWLVLFNEAVEHLSRFGFLPAQVLIVGPGAALPGLKELIGSEKFKRHTIFGTPFSASSEIPAEIKSIFAAPDSLLNQPGLAPIHLYYLAAI